MSPRLHIAAGHLHAILPNHLDSTGTFWMLWPTSKYALPKPRSLIDYMSDRLFEP